MTPRYLRYPVAAALAAASLIAAAPPFASTGHSRPSEDPCRKHQVSWFYGDDVDTRIELTRTTNGATVRTNTSITPDVGGPFPGPLNQLGERTGSNVRSSAKECVTQTWRQQVARTRSHLERP